MKNILIFVELLLLSIICANGYSQIKHPTNVYDSIIYRVTISSFVKTPTRQGVIQSYKFIDDSLLTYIKINLKGERVEIRKRAGTELRCQIIVGNFDCYQKAIPLRDKLIANGFTESFIHGFQCHADGTLIKDMRKITAKRCSDEEYLDIESNKNNEKFEYDSIWFKVRITNYKDSIPEIVWTYIKDNLKENQVHITKFNDEAYRIDASNNVAGFKCYEEALPLLKRIISDGYKDAHIVAYFCMDEMNVEEAKKIKIGKCGR